MYTQDTIYGVSTLRGRSGVAIIRISGIKAFYALEALGVLCEIKDRIATVCKIYNTCAGSADSKQLDECLLLKFCAPNSFTGENVLELHLHGSVSVIDDTLAALGKIDSFRLAEPGEFSKRAFYNEKLDLTQAEGLALLIDSETTKQREIALKQLSGSLENIYENWREQIISILANIEALIDFPEEDIPSSILSEINLEVGKLSIQIKKHIESAHKGISIMDGIQIPIIGPPNAGKSSIMNRLAGEDIAITSDTAGTTRDVISVKVNIAGYCAILKDTAGIRDSSDSIEQQGVVRALAELERADIAIVLVERDNLDESVLKHLDKRCILVVNKVDRDENVSRETLKYVESYLKTIEQAAGIKVLYVSAKYDINMNLIIDAIRERIEKEFATNEAIITKLRYKEKLENCYKILNSFNTNQLLDLTAQNLRDATSEIEEITGRVDIEEIIDKIFFTFCIGK